jgi:penicillin-binding protein 1A
LVRRGYNLPLLVPRSARKQAPARPRRRIRKLRLLGLLLILFVLGSVSFMFGLVTAIASEIPSLDPARLQKQEVDGYIYAGVPSKRVLAVLRGSQSRILVSSGDISPKMKHAIVAVEDKRFYEHRGVDIHGIVRAVWEDVRNKKVVEGGSTITQQFVKNTYLHNQRSIGRKLKEAALAWQLEQRWSKDKILTAYLNTIYFGNGAYGIEQASLTYFHHKAKYMSWAEAALLAGIPSDPSQFDPVTSPKAARERREIVLRDLLQQGDITQADFDRANRAALPNPDDVHLSGKQGPAPYFTNYVEQQLIDRYGSGRVFGGGLRVHSTIDLNVQRIARQAITKWLTDPNGPSAALVAVDPRTGKLLAMIGGNNYRKSQFNLAVQGERQPGSSFKPFVLATALRQGISPATEFESGAVQIPLGDKVWYVHNYENSDLGRISLATATEYSDNTVFAQLTQLVGPGAIVRTAKSLGITSPLKNYFAIGLGAEAVNPLEMARAFSAFANGGKRMDGAAFGNHPRAISVVRNDHGQAVDDNHPLPRQVLTPQTAAILTSLLQSVVTGGTGKQAQLSDGRQVAGKTGTTENYGDAWFVGFTPQIVAAVWVGYPDKLIPMTTEFHGKPVAGGTFPALIWKAFMEKALPYLKLTPAGFPSPQTGWAAPVTVVNRGGVLERDDGVCTNTYSLEFYGGVGPKRVATCKKNEVEIPDVVGQPLAAAKSRLAGQPLEAAIVYKPAKAGDRVGYVVGQFPRGGTASAHDKITLISEKSLTGVVPRVVGLPLAVAQARLAKAHLKVKVVGGSQGKVVKQSLPASTAARPGGQIVVTVKA